MVKILYNGLGLSSTPSGVQYYTEYLIAEAFRHTDDKAYVLLTQNYGKSRVPEYPHSTFQINGRFHRIVFEHFCLPGIYKRNRFDILHCPAYILPWNFRGRSVVTVHDIIALDYPELCKTSNSLYFSLSLARSIQRADRIISVSEHVKNDIVRKLGIIPDKIAVTRLGVSPLFRPVSDSVILRSVRNKYRLPEHYLLFVGNIEPKKNLVRLIRAYNVVRRRSYPNLKLVLAGQLGWKYKAVTKVVSQWRLEEKVLFLGYVPLADLPSLYTMANLFVFPSLYEGFGLPPLEAMACGIPVVTSTAGALPETTAGYAIYADPFSESDLADKIEQGLSIDHRRTEQGMQYAQRQTWQKTWTETLAVYQSLL